MSDTTISKINNFPNSDAATDVIKAIDIIYEKLENPNIFSKHNYTFDFLFKDRVEYNPNGVSLTIYGYTLLEDRDKIRYGHPFSNLPSWETYKSNKYHEFRIIASKIALPSQVSGIENLTEHERLINHNINQFLMGYDHLFEYIFFKLFIKTDDYKKSEYFLELFIKSDFKIFIKRYDYQKLGKDSNNITSSIENNLTYSESEEGVTNKEFLPTKNFLKLDVEEFQKIAVKNKIDAIKSKVTYPHWDTGEKEKNQKLIGLFDKASEVILEMTGSLGAGKYVPGESGTDGSNKIIPINVDHSDLVILVNDSTWERYKSVVGRASGSLNLDLPNNSFQGVELKRDARFNKDEIFVIHKNFFEIRKTDERTASEYIPSEYATIYWHDISFYICHWPCYPIAYIKQAI